MSQLPIKSPKLVRLFDKRLRELEMSKTDFIRKITKESLQQKLEPPSPKWVYRILNGTVIIGEDHLLPRFCKSLGIPLPDAIAALRDDKIHARGWVAPKSSKTVQEAMILMDTLSKRNQEGVLRYIEMRASSD